MFMPVTLAFTSLGNDYYVGNVTTDIYADPGSTVTLNATPITGTTFQTELAVSGYLTD
jgi:hypothetical protein